MQVSILNPHDFLWMEVLQIGALAPIHSVDNQWINKKKVWGSLPGFPGITARPKLIQK